MWRPIQVGATPLGFDETGIVASQSAVLSAENISIFYVSTFSTDFVLVPERRLEVATEVISKTWPLTLDEFPVWRE